MAPTLTPDRALFRQIVEEIAVKAKATLPDANGRVDKAVALVLSGDVELLPDGTARVFSQSNGITSYLVVNGHCECKDYKRAPSQWCKHRIAHGIQVRVAARLPQATPEPELEHHEAPATEPLHGMAREHVVLIHGRPHVRYQGLLAMAHAAGLVSLKARFVGTPTLELAVAEAEATFADGRVFVECGDATPANIQAPNICPHLLRMALTRAKARCLRDALNIGDAAVEELE